MPAPSSSIATWPDRMRGYRTTVRFTLIQSELFRDLQAIGFNVGPGQLGENITTKGINLLLLPLGARLHLGASAVVELTGLRTPCGYIDKFKKGLKRAMIVRMQTGFTFRAGVLGVVRASGDVAPGDIIRTEVIPGLKQSLRRFNCCGYG